MTKAKNKSLGSKKKVWKKKFHAKISSETTLLLF
jgi:hypothetical protein